LFQKSAFSLNIDSDLGLVLRVLIENAVSFILVLHVQDVDLC